MKSFITNHAISIILLIVAVAYLFLHRRYNKTNGGLQSYPDSPVSIEPQETSTPVYMTRNRATKFPVQTIDVSESPLAESMSFENLMSAAVSENRGVN